jgi:hypothetical protein
VPGAGGIGVLAPQEEFRVVRYLIAALFVLGAGASAARADRAAADRCAASLPPAGKTLYDKSLSDVIGGSTIEDALRSSARPMVIMGSLSRDEARAAAEAAAPCLRQAQ